MSAGHVGLERLIFFAIPQLLQALHFSPFVPTLPNRRFSKPGTPGLSIVACKW